jgi:hypothetical protein
MGSSIASGYSMGAVNSLSINGSLPIPTDGGVSNHQIKT